MLLHGRPFMDGTVPCSFHSTGHGGRKQPSVSMSKPRTQALDSLFGSEPSHPCSVLDDCAWHGQQVMVGSTDQGSDPPKLRARAPDIPTFL